ncbi:MAG: DsrE/DsrF/DrsH-like family protein [Promethearchaeota archaeon]
MSKEKKKLAIIVHSGTFDKLYCAFILGTAATAMDIETHMYFTFWGLNALVKEAMDKTGLPAIYKDVEDKIKTKFAEIKYPTPYEMLKRMKTTGLVTIYACSPTMAVFGITKDDLIPEVDKIAGAAEFLDISMQAETTIQV